MADIRESAVPAHSLAHKPRYVARLAGRRQYSRFGYAGWSPAGLILVVLLVMWLTGNLHR